MKGLISSEGNHIAKKFNNSFRYIDDVLHVSKYCQEFKNNIHNIYDPSLNLEPTADIQLNCDFLDLYIEVKQNTLHTSLFNKTDLYKFSVLRYPHFLSNIDTKAGLNTITGELTRFARVCCEYKDFEERVLQLAKFYICNKWPIRIVANRIFRVLHSYPSIRHKFGLGKILPLSLFQGIRSLNNNQLR